MKTVYFVVALFCLSTQAMAQDPCDLVNKRLEINGNGHARFVAPHGFTAPVTQQDGTRTYTAASDVPNQLVTVQCKGRHITFKLGTQEYDGWIFERQPSLMAGFFSHNGQQKYGWDAWLAPVL